MQEMDIAELHWLMGMIQHLEVGLVALDRDCRIKVWNTFMANHSGLSPDRVRDKPLFELFPEIPEAWFRRKIDTALTLNQRAFIIAEQRPWLFRFRNFRPITGGSEYMFQNVTIVPLSGHTGTIDHVCLMVYDVTETMLSRQGLTAANARLMHLSRTDRLTELNNRGYWEECLAREYKRWQRTHQPMSVIMFDIDHFKKVNDGYGHPAGDEVIRTVSRVLRKNLRETDIPGRYGGEEFGVILVNTDAASAHYVAERLRKRVEATEAVHDGTAIHFTISLGVSELNDSMLDYKHWLETSDQALYASKEGGRNRATVYGAS